MFVQNKPYKNTRYKNPFYSCNPLLGFYFPPPLFFFANISTSWMLSLHYTLNIKYETVHLLNFSLPPTSPYTIAHTLFHSTAAEKKKKGFKKKKLVECQSEYSVVYRRIRLAGTTCA